MLDLIDTVRSSVLRHADHWRTETAVPGLVLSTRSDTTAASPAIYQPMVCLVLQGAKEVLLGDRVLRYGPGDYCLAMLEISTSGCVVEASPQAPFVAAVLTLEPQKLAALTPDAAGHAPEPPVAPAISVSRATSDMLDAWRRLIALLDRPADIPVLAPMVEREILYRLLQGPDGGCLRQLGRADSRVSRIRQAIAWIRENYDRRLSVAELSRSAGMSPASFHRHFRDATAMSPVAYQKRLRLQQARRLLLSRADVAEAGLAVGYQSPSQFSREYVRMFGAPPARDAMRLRGEATARDAA